MAIFKKKTKGLQAVEAANLFTLNDPSAVATEQIKTIRTNISFSQEAQNLQTIMITSTVASEGKSTISANLAVEFAHAGKNTLLIDTDLRRSTVDQTFGLHGTTKGLTSYLVHRFDELTDVIHKTEVENLSVIPSGPIPPNPAELIASQGMKDVLDKLKESFDLVIVDAPPLLPVTDGQIMANMVDGVVLVVRQNHTLKSGVKEAKQTLENAKANILGVVFNDVESSNDHGYYGEGYYYNNEQ